MKKVIVALILTLLVPVTSVKADYCKNSDVAKYKGLASNINTSYDYTEIDGEVTFSITLNNLNKDLYIVDVTTDIRYNYQSEELIIRGYKPKQKVKFNVYSTDPLCADRLLYTIRLELPGYNPHYNDPICEGVENYIYCQKWYSHNLDYQDFYNKVKNYKDGLNQEVTEEEKEVETIGLLLAIWNFWKQYYYVISPIIIVISSTVIIVINKKSNIYN